MLTAQHTDTTILRSADTAVIKADTTSIITDSSVVLAPVLPFSSYHLSVKKLLSDNDLLNSNATPVSMVELIKKGRPDDALFYILMGLVFLLALLRVFFRRYFTNLFKVFFNTSLRQSQLTDQLLQAKFPSLLFNLFFMVSGGLFIYFLLVYYHWINGQHSWLIMGSSVGLLILIYTLKYSLLKFTGWLTGFNKETNIYIFIFFLINKIIGIFLVPVIIIMAFSKPVIVQIVLMIALIITGLLLLLRFFRSYGLLQGQLKVSRFHFLLYIVGVEILPLLLIYKTLMILLNKNL